jgi:general secretion pathway protein E
MQPRDLNLFSELLKKPHGIILVTGPTGSGKTTSLYAGLSSINDATKNILTVEDPIEYNLEGIGQTQVNTKADMTFARGLRAMLRQDPDVVMVGEIRDLETAEIAVQASLTGHLVLSTLHTNTAIGAVTRLVDMGVEPFLLSSSLVGLLAQRLVRVLCPHCKEAHQASDAECELLQADKNNPPTIYRAKGCVHCKQLGYLGRTGVYELVAVDDKMRELIHNRVSEAELTAYARTKGPSIRDDGAARILSGETTVEEVLRVTQEE